MLRGHEEAEATSAQRAGTILAAPLPPSLRLAGSAEAATAALAATPKALANVQPTLLGAASLAPAFALPSAELPATATGSGDLDRARLRRGLVYTHATRTWANRFTVFGDGPSHLLDEGVRPSPLGSSAEGSAKRGGRSQACGRFLSFGKGN